jgi:hypothetical protein
VGAAWPSTPRSTPAEASGEQRYHAGAKGWWLTDTATHNAFPCDPSNPFNPCTLCTPLDPECSGCDPAVSDCGRDPILGCEPYWPKVGWAHYLTLLALLNSLLRFHPGCPEPSCKLNCQGDFAFCLGVCPFFGPAAGDCALSCIVGYVLCLAHFPYGPCA